MGIANKALRKRLIDADILLDKQSVENIRKEHDGIYMFFSFDLENSTRFKTKFKDKWSKLLLIFYEKIKLIFKSQIENEQNKYNHDCVLPVNVWKIVGDEILFYKKIEYPQELFYNVKAMYYTMNDFYNEICDMDSFKIQEKTVIKSNIDIKGSAWIAKCEEDKQSRYNYIYGNALTSNQDSNVLLGQHLNQIDFLGPDIDEGFRIGKYCSKRKVTVSATLAYILYYLSENYNTFSDLDKKDINSLFRIVSYEKLKGIWEDRLYPIIFYTHIWDNINELFNYDDYLKDDTVINYEKIKAKGKYGISYLQKILNDLNIEVDIKRLIEDDILKLDYNKSNSQSMDKPRRASFVNSEVHCVAMCINDDNKILMLKRSPQRNLFPNKWECGCAKINSNESWATCLRKEYKNNLNLDIQVEENPIPIATYTFKKSGIVVPGIIFKAQIKETESNNISFDKNKYCDCRFMNEDEVDQLTEEDVVENLKENIKKVFKKNN
ncbi:NUDIX hydrolase [Inconstantimicrobium porci]|uniref:Nudix hydrolase domain-containing protein n=1 Tax=Inconstantimicrobium porci TaxID=2652291 RepID=A0A7X2N016_9CLOT|nr:hypothetical protein [Inconstantimicrobium porci]MSR92271.1 hypothetical protein [Inconstantimicrobium porci]